MKIPTEKECYIVDEKGEIFDTLESRHSYIKIKEGDRILRKKTISFLSNTTEVKYHFIKVNPVALSKYCKKYSILPILISYVGYMDNVLSYDNGKVVKVKSLPDICEVSYSTIKRQIKGMIQDDVLHKSKVDNKTVLILNPWLCFKGKRINKDLYDEFKSSALKNEIEELV